jgi:hypothetical protein
MLLVDEPATLNIPIMAALKKGQPITNMGYPYLY